MVKRSELGRRVGEDHPRAWLTDQQVREMRDLRERCGWTVPAIAAHFRAAFTTTRAILLYTRRNVVAQHQ